MLNLVDGYWLPVTRTDARAYALYRRHYSAQKNHRYRRSGNTNFVGPTEHMVLLTLDCRAVFVWQRSTVPRLDHQEGVGCSLFRNEGRVRSSELIAEARQLARTRWPGQRLFTYVDPSRVESANPGYCFQQDGWTFVRDAAGRPQRTPRGLLLLERVS